MDATLGRLAPAHPRTSVCNHPCWWHVCVSGRMLLPEDPMGTSPNPQQPHSSTYTQAHRTSDEVILMTPEIFLDLIETLLPITSPAGIPVHTSPWGLVPKARPGGDPAACRNSPFYGCILYQLGGLALGTGKLGTNDTLQGTTLAQLPLSRPAFQCTLSLRSLGRGG